MTQISIFTTDANLIVRSWDSWLAQITGINSNIACGQSLTTLIPDLESRGLLSRFQNVLTSGTIETLAPALHHYLIACPAVAPAKYFAKMQQRVTIAPWWENSRIVGTVVTIEDVTARLEQERDRGMNIETQMSLSLQSPSLTSTLGNESWRLRQQAVDNLVQQDEQAISASLLRAMREQHRNPSVLNSVLQVMALSNVDVIVPLIEFLHDSDVDLRIYAALALGEQQDERAIPALLKALADPDINVRYHAIDDLGYLRANQVVEALASIAVSSDFFLAFAAIEALRRIGDPTVAPRLVPLLTNEMLSEPVVNALIQISDEEVVAPLGELLNTEMAPVEAIAQIFNTVYTKYQNIYREGSHIADLARRAINQNGLQNLLDALPQTKPEELQPLVLTLSWLEGALVESTLTNLLAQPTVRKDVVEALVRYGNSVTELLIAQLDAQDWETSHAAIVALGRIGDARAVPALKELLTTEGRLDYSEGIDYDEEATSTHSLVIAAAEALAQIGDRRAFEALLNLIGHPTVAVRQAAIAALDSLGHPQMPSCLVALLQDTNPFVRESAVKIAGYFAYPECVDLLFERCHDPDERVLRAAIEHIPYLEDDRVVPTLVAAIGSSQPKVRATAARALAHIDSQQAFPHLLAAIKDPDAWVRYYAVRSIGRHSYPEALIPLAQLVQIDAAQQVRAAAIEVLGQIGGARAVTTLATIAAVENKDLELSRAAVLALGQIGHPDALAPLLNVLRSPLPQRRIDALTALGTRGRAYVADTLQWIAASDPEPHVTLAAIDALVRIGTKEAIAALIELTAEPARRDAAVTALAQFDEAQIEAVAQGLQHPNTGVRRAVIEALTRLKHQRASELLSHALSDTDGLVRLAAVTALGHLGNRNAEPQLATMARNDPDTAVRRAAQKAIQNT